ncbi:FliO/MopB family protein [Variovorax sp. VNK109]|uniref:FliO/MopB family protein n=1 Tax=Variovorax sp. VNK109 TaxID=3400919 RepID=UPI003BFEFEC9
MAQSLFLIVVFIGVLALFPVALRWLQRKQAGVTGAVPASAKLVSAIAVGPQQRVVTVEVGPENARTWLVLGVTGQGISCLHSIPVAAGAAAAPTATSPATAPATTPQEPVFVLPEGTPRA